MTAKKRTGFNPAFTITPTIANGLMRIEAARQAIQMLPIIPRVLVNLRGTPRQFSTHYSAMIEANRLTQKHAAQIVGGDHHTTDRTKKSRRYKPGAAHAALVDESHGHRAPSPAPE